MTNRSENTIDSVYSLENQDSIYKKIEAEIFYGSNF